MFLNDFNSFEVAFAVFAIFLGGLVKGTVGLGMKIVALGLLANVMALPVAIAVIIVPGIASNVWQIVGGPPLRATLGRLWSFFAVFLAEIWFGTEVLVASDPRLVTAALGAVLVVYATYALIAPRLPHPGPHERWLSPVIGSANGVLAGMTGSDALPGVPYMQCLGLDREQLIQAMGLLFLFGSVAIAVAFVFQGLLTVELGIASGVATLPTLAGYWLGEKPRRRISETRFRQLMLIALLALGLYIVIGNLA
jgi:uncharacterized membrane protein YfcA